MKHWYGIKKGRLAFGAGIVALAISGGTLFAGRSHAAYTVCNTDPTVQLSNGTTVTMWAQLDVDPMKIAHVSYVLHVPVGVQMQSISYDQYGYLEGVQIIADQNGHHYMTETTATTSTRANVTAFATV